MFSKRSSTMRAKWGERTVWNKWRNLFNPSNAPLNLSYPHQCLNLCFDTLWCCTGLTKPSTRPFHAGFKKIALYNECLVIEMFGEFQQIHLIHSINTQSGHLCNDYNARLLQWFRHTHSLLRGQKIMRYSRNRIALEIKLQLSSFG